MKEYTDEELEKIVVEAASFLDTTQVAFEAGKRDFDDADMYIIGLSAAMVEIWKKYQSSLSYSEKLLKDLSWLRCLEEAGVDNWEGIDFAFELQETINLKKN